MSDGSKLRQSWYSALNEAEAEFRQLLTSPAAEWKRLSHAADSSTPKQKGSSKPRVSLVPELADVVVHRKSSKSGEDVYRMVLDVPAGEELVSLEPWKSVLTTPELRQEWDPAVEDAHLVEMFDRSTRIAKTNYTLGWPANPRDSVTISRAFYDSTTLVDISTSLPRSPDEPAYLRPSPPFVRSHVQLFAWCIQYIQPTETSPRRIRTTCFWQHDLKALWGFGTSTAALTQQLSTMTLSLLKTVMKRGGRVPKLAGYGNGTSIERIRYQLDREALTVDYAVIPNDEEHNMHQEMGMEEMHHAVREYRRLTRSIECVLPSLEGWDVQVTMKGSSEEVERIPWTAHATRSTGSSNPSISPVPDQVILRLTHGALTDDDAVLKVKVVIEVSGATRGLRLNGLATKIHDLEERDPSSYALPQKMLQDVASAVDLSIQTSSSLGTVSSSNASSSISAGGLQGVARPPTVRTPAAEKTILSKVRRNYIYFSSLLQEPEAKWKRTTEARGVSITQLDSIDPTLVVYRAEATFVGVGLWDLYGAVVSPGARVYWDKQHEDGVLLEDVNELTELWHFKTKPAWPVNGRDSVVLKTVYKSPSTIHVFSFSADDPHLFPHIPPAEPNVIRTQVDLQGWAIEALSPTTTLLTLLEQSDPKGWTNKTSIPTQMINTLAGIGEFTIKCGGPPFVTRLAGSKANEIRYDHERGTFKVEYEPCQQRRSNNSSSGSGQQDEGDVPAIECEIRCDVDTWCSSLDIVVDPPPQTISCLRRHRLSVDGGGLWLTLTHDSIFVDDERLLVLVRRAPGKEKGLVMVNGAKVNVDVEELSEGEIKALTRQKRVKPPRIPLDQPPVMTVIRRRKAEWTAGEDGEKGNNAAANASSTTTSTISSWASAPKISSPLSRFFTYAVDQATTTTQQAVAAISPANMAGANGMSSMDPAKPPMYYALQALAWTQDYNAREGSSSSISSSLANPGSGSTAATADGWTLVSDKGMTVQRKLIPDISTFIPVHKGFKVIEGVSAEELAMVLTEVDCRKTWDDRYDSARVLETFGGLARTEYVTKKGGFPFRDRGFFLASLVATGDGSTVSGVGSSSSSSLRPSVSSTSGGSLGISGASSSSSSSSSSPATNAIYLVSASYSPPINFDAAKYNPYALPIGRVYIDAWILETLDPYNTKEKYTIPSARCTRLVAVDYGGAVPAAFNGMINAGMARSVLGVEAFVKSGGRKMAIPVMRMPALGFEVVGQAEDEQEKKEKEDRGTGSEKTAQVVLGVPVRPLTGWTLKKKEKEGERRVLVGSTFNVEKKVYRSRMLVHAPASSKVVRSKTKSAEGRMRKEASDATIGATRASQRESRERQSAMHAQSSSLASTSASASHLLAPRPRRDRTISDDQISLRSVRSDSTLSPPEIGSEPAQDSRVHSDDDDDDVDYEHMSASTTSILAMPGAMMPGLKAKAAFPTSTVGVGLSSLGRRDAISPQRTGSGARTIKTSMSGSAASPSSGGSTSTTTPPRLRQRAASSSAGPISFYGHSRSISYSQSQTTTPRQELNQDPFAPDAGGGSGNNFGLGSNLHARARTTSSSVYMGGSSSSLPGSSVIAASMEHRRGREKERENKSKGKGEMVLLEVVVDSRMYSSGYKVDLKARRHDALAIQQHRGGGNAAPIPLLSPLDVGSASTSTSTIGKDDEVLKVPFITHIYTLPSSPLHSSSLAEGDASKNPAVRYLITVSVKTTQVDDSKVEWLDALEGGGLVVDMAVSPLGSIGMVQSKKGKVLVNGVEESVMDEKESLSGLGRERLADDRLSSVGQLVRFPSEPDRLPEQFQTPVGIADDLLIPSTAPSSSANSNPAPDGSSTSAQGGEGMNGGDIDNDSSGRNGEDSPHTPKLELDRLASGHEMAGGAGTGSGGFLGFLQGYGSLGQFARVGSRRETGVLPVVGDGEDESNSGLQAKGEANTTSTESSGTGGTAGAATTAVGIARPTTTYSTSTLVFVALIAFLMGSLLRSLLSPADFMYVATEDGTGVESGWREMRRLFEMKYIAGGWDLQVAVVRRRVLE
ncbi:hypothetical protein D9613_007202 [Agrocybe pediades]|uniref:START domain-containing protein n=1 Tax=Agrocybe pediades TaxID=84607 RepID=A0A8H4QG06_9AGAR|nr:hypothetical protein D9613_007202 [Agrocybe pediades]